MTDWKVRIPGRHAIGPVSTELLIRGIRARRIPFDAEVTQMGLEAWAPLASVDEFYEAMGLAEAPTAFVQTPWGPRGTPSCEQDEPDDEDAVTRMVESRPELLANADDEDAVTRMVESRPELLANADDEDDQATRLMSSASVKKGRRGLEKTTARDLPMTRERVRAPSTRVGAPGKQAARGRPNTPLPSNFRDRSRAQGGAPSPTLGRSGPSRSPAVPVDAPAVGRSDGSARIAAVRSSQTGNGSSLAARPRLTGDTRPITREAPPARAAAGAGEHPWDRRRPSTTALPLLDADEGDDESGSGSLDSKAQEQFPSIRPLVAAAQASQRDASHPGSAVSPIERHDERTAPALRLQQAYARTRTALIVIMGVLGAVVIALIVLLLRR